jgi:hypothetical protein
MHDYVKGAFEALSWVRQSLKNDKSLEQILKEIEQALEDINEGVALDFRDRLKPMHY